MFPIDLPGREGNSSRWLPTTKRRGKQNVNCFPFRPGRVRRAIYRPDTRNIGGSATFLHTIHASIPFTINQPSSTGLHRVIQCRRAISNVIQEGCFDKGSPEKGKGDLDVSSCVEYFSRGVGNSLEACIVFPPFLFSFFLFSFNLNF